MGEVKSDHSVTSSGKAESPSLSPHRAAHCPPEKEVQDMRQRKACREFKPMPAEYQNLWLPRTGWLRTSRLDTQHREWQPRGLQGMQRTKAFLLG